MKMIMSPQKAAILDWVENGEGSIVVEAVAGSGKTTLLIDAIAKMLGSVFFGAYNTGIVAEIVERVAKVIGERDDLDIKTMHAQGFAAWRKFAPNVSVEKDKCRIIYRDLIEDMHDSMKFWEACTLKLVSYAKQSCLGLHDKGDIDNDAIWLGYIDHYDIDTLSSDQKAIDMAKKVLKASMAQDNVFIDFDDMIFAPLIHGAKFQQYDWVLLDECQDSNEARRVMAQRMLKKGGRMMAVGDRHQAIYGFTGSNSDSMDLIQKAINAVQMPLTVSYRCPKLVVAKAQQWVSHIQADANAPDGVVSEMDHPRGLIKMVKAGDAVLCRYNAPLVEQAYKMIAAGVPAKVEGREIGQGLVKLVKKMKVNSLDLLVAKLEEYEAKEVAKLDAKDQKNKVQAVQDRVYCLMVLIGRAQETISEGNNDPVGFLCGVIDSIFGDAVTGNVVVLSSIHKAKGREWKRVFWMQAWQNKNAKREWMIEQEKNLNYVAATRAKAELVIVQFVPQKRFKREA